MLTKQVAVNIAAMSYQQLECISVNIGKIQYNIHS